MWKNSLTVNPIRTLFHSSRVPLLVSSSYSFSEGRFYVGFISLWNFRPKIRVKCWYEPNHLHFRKWNSSRNDSFFWKFRFESRENTKDLRFQVFELEIEFCPFQSAYRTTYYRLRTAASNPFSTVLHIARWRCFLRTLVLYCRTFSRNFRENGSILSPIFARSSLATRRFSKLARSLLRSLYSITTQVWRPILRSTFLSFPAHFHARRFSTFPFRYFEHRIIIIISVEFLWRFFLDFWVI